ALGELGDPTIAPELLQLLKQHGKTDLTCYRIAVVLGKLGNRDVIPDLQYLLQDNQFHDYVRSGIVTALRIMADQHIVAYFMQVLKDEHIKEYVRCQVARAFNEISREYIPVTDLFHILECANINSAVRAELAATICTLGEQEAIPGLLQLLIDPQTDTPLRVSIVSILGCLTNPSVLSPLHELLKQPGLPIDLQGNILASLSMTGEDGILPDVLAFLEGQEFPLVCPRAQINLFTALGHVGRRNPLYEQDIIQQLLKRLRDKQVNVYVGRSITEALAMLNLQAYVPELLDLLVDHANINSYIRQGIAITLSQCRQDSSIQQRLLMLLQDSDIPDDIFEALRKSCRS
ncbi:MAG TPA: HEAT repeat domain-containing protein, partial [Ktedonobacteraceae bacterium]